MSTPVEVLDSLHADVEDLDRLSKAIASATLEYVEAEETFDELLDAVADDLRETYREEGVKRDPAEHTILTVTRKAHRAEYQRLRRAKRRIELLQQQSSNRRSMVEGRRSELSALKGELQASDGPQPQPQWSAA